MKLGFIMLFEPSEFVAAWLLLVGTDHEVRVSKKNRTSINGHL